MAHKTLRLSVAALPWPPTRVIATALCLCALFSSQRAHALFEQREIAAVSRSQSADLFVIDSDFSIKHYFRTTPGGRFNGVVQLDGMGRDVAAVERGDGSFEVFVVGMDGDVWSNLQLGRARWRGFRLMGFHCKRIAVTKTRAGRYELFVIGKDDVVWRSVRDGDDGAWSEWHSLGAKALQLSAASDGASVQVFTVGLDQTIWTSDSQHVAWSKLDGLARDVAVGGGSDGNMTLFATDDQGNVWQRHGFASPQLGAVGAFGPFSAWTNLAGSAARVAAGDALGGAQTLFSLGTRISELEPHSQRWRALEEKLPLELTFYGVATVALPDVSVLQRQIVQIGVRFSSDHKRVAVVTFPSFTTSAFNTPFGKNTTTVSLKSGGAGTFDPATGRVELQLTLHFDQSLDVPLIQEDADVALNLTTDGARQLAQGPMFAEAELSGASRLMASGGVNPLNGMACRVSVAGYFVAPAALLRSPVR